MVAAHQAAGGVFGLAQLLVALVIDFAGGLRIEYLGDAEGGLQLQVGPVVQGVAHGIGNRFGPLLELLPVGGVLARAVAFVHAVGAHGAPLVVVAAQPDFGQRAELVVVGHHLGDEVAVVVDNRHLGRMFVVELLRSFGLQQEVFIHKVFHNPMCFDI